MNSGNDVAIMLGDFVDGGFDVLGEILAVPGNQILTSPAGLFNLVSGLELLHQLQTYMFKAAVDAAVQGDRNAKES